MIKWLHTVQEKGLGFFFILFQTEKLIVLLSGIDLLGERNHIWPPSKQIHTSLKHKKRNNTKQQNKKADFKFWNHIYTHTTNKNTVIKLYLYMCVHLCIYLHTYM